MVDERGRIAVERLIRAPTAAIFDVIVLGVESRHREMVTERACGDVEGQFGDRQHGAVSLGQCSALNYAVHGCVRTQEWI